MGIPANVPVDFRGECHLHGTRILVSQLLNNTCVTMRDTGASTRLVMDAKNSLWLSSKWSEGDNLEHTEARDLICNKQLWSRFLRSWVTDDTVELLTSKTKKQKVNVKDVVTSLWDAVAFLVNVARKDETTEAEREKFADTAAAARRYHRAMNTEGRSGLAATQTLRPSAWTHIFCHLPPAQHPPLPREPGPVLAVRVRESPQEGTLWLTGLFLFNCK